MIKYFVRSLVTKFGTKSPFELCENLNINVLFVDLPESVDGFFLNSENKNSILIKQDLSPPQKEKVCAHELAHALLHSCVNVTHYENTSPGYVDELEAEADLFAQCLLEDSYTYGDK